MGPRVRAAASLRALGRTGEARIRGGRRTGRVAGWANRARRRGAAGRDHAANHPAGRVERLGRPSRGGPLSQAERSDREEQLNRAERSSRDGPLNRAEQPDRDGPLNRAPGRRRAWAALAHWSAASARRREARARRVAAWARPKEASDRQVAATDGRPGPMEPNQVLRDTSLAGGRAAVALLVVLGPPAVPAGQEVLLQNLARGHRGAGRAGRSASTRSSVSGPGLGASVGRYRGPAARRGRRGNRPGRARGPRKRRHAAGGRPGSGASRRALTAGPAGASRPWRRRAPPGRPGRPPRAPGPREGLWWRYDLWGVCWSDAS